MEWEELAVTLMKENKELKRKRDEVILPLLQKSLKLIEEYENPEPLRSHPYADAIAPKGEAFHTILSMCEPDERETLFRRALAKINPDGEWTGGMTGSTGLRPAMNMSTRRAKKEREDGLRPTKVRSGRKKSIMQPLVGIPTTHILLVGYGFYPRKCDEASHLCHKSTCVDIDHLFWESTTKNRLREKMCRRRGVCVCGLEPVCIFVHKE